MSQALEMNKVEMLLPVFVQVVQAVPLCTLILTLLGLLASGSATDMIGPGSWMGMRLYSH